MPSLREAATQALEALEGKRYTACGWRSDCDKAITALKAALAEHDKKLVWVEERKAHWAEQLQLARETQERERQQREEAALAEHYCDTHCTWADHAPGCALADGDNLSPTGCDHCRHPLYAAIKCRNCGRVTG